MEVSVLELTIRGLVFSKYNSISEFADAMGWQRNKASRIVNRKQDPSKKDMEDMIAVLEIPKASIAPVFFGSMFTE